ncbi:DUF1800 domain-containing protein [Pseudomaricurvus alkylphenolicus]|uniref:DUF1800 domain-containing protein n=1 Tax=Pseudomaricurvus alkylphenolicus TaxID=1306991 RepID=UPI001421479E|nr:DUF1800 domain-containing protein [Pseudomaricurvus alkylphenolicus]NIB40168.1 DUF1800 domain-containing protein [Pseudomaricurvus alkylphenolicus]
MQTYKRWLSQWLGFLTLLVASFSSGALADALPLTLLDADSGEPLVGIQVVAKEVKADGSLSWRQRRDTGEGGVAEFDLDFSSGQSYLFELTAFNGFRARLGPVSEAGPTELSVGNLRIAVLDGTQEGTPAFAEQTVKLQRTDDEGVFRTIAYLTTNSLGLLKLDLAEHRYRLMARSPISGRWKVSEEFDGSEGVDFTVGELPLSLQVTNAKTGTSIPNVEVVAKRVTDDGLHWYGKLLTDADGRIEWELEGLNEGQAFQLSTRHLGPLSSIKTVTESGDLNWIIGTVKLQLLNGTLSQHPALTNHSVVLQRETEDGFRSIATLQSDEQGQVQFDLLESDEPQNYQLRSVSPTDGRTSYYYPFNNPGEHRFVVGNIPLTVAVQHGQTGAPMAGIEVVLRELLDTGEYKWVGKKVTDSNGVLVADLPRLGNGQKIFLNTKQFNNKWSVSEAITEPGERDWAVGSIQVRLFNGNVTDNSAGSDSPLEPLAEHRLDLLAQKGSETTRIASYTSDEQGLVLLDLPPNVEADAFLVSARSAFDGRTLYQQRIDGPGAFDLVVGHAPMQVSLVQAGNGTPLPEREVVLTRLDEEGKYRYHAKAVTDAAGLAQFSTAAFDGNNSFRLRVRAFNNYTAHSESFTEPEDRRWELGKLVVQVRDGSQTEQPPLVDHVVDLRAYQLETGESRWVGRATSDAQGKLLIDPPALGQGEVYRLKSRALSDGRYKTSGDLGAEGNFEFVVGNPPVQVQVVDLLSDEPVVEQYVKVQTLNEEQQWQNLFAIKTNPNGVAVFDLPGITEGRQFRFRTRKYAGYAYSDVVTQPGALTLEVGALPVTLVNRDTNSVLSNVRVQAYRLADGGSLAYEASGYTDAQGQVVFDLQHLGSAAYVLKAVEPFDNVSRIYSSGIFNAGPYQFAIAPDDDQGIDTQAPSIEIVAPQQQQIALGGFQLRGIASDDRQLVSIQIQAQDNLGNAQQLTLTPEGNGEWSVDIPAAWLALNSELIITATASDRMGNRDSVSATYEVVEDATAPQLAVTSHQNGDDVRVSGFTLAGTVTDDIGVASLTLTLQDSALGTVLDEQPVQLGSDQWAYFVSNGLVAENSDLQLVLLALDNSGNSAQVELQLSTFRADPLVRQLLQRGTFGMTPDLETEVNAVGVQNWLDAQLNPAGIDDSPLEALISQLPLEEIDDLRRRELIYQIFSERQLQQVMAWFWENHFSTNYRAHNNTLYEAAENDGFRDNALGRFRDLLGISAKSPAMLEYLNNVQSRANNINENYARELMELHTLGVDGGYTQEDVIALARILTGWGVADGQFMFFSNNHDSEDKLFLGQTITGGGLEEGEQVLDLLSRHPSTARFVCGKLVTFWVSETSQPDLQGQCASTFLATDGDIAAVVRVILESDAFSSPDNLATKVKTPLEFYLSAMRALDVDAEPDVGIELLADLGMPLFARPAPDGYSEVGADWINVDAMLQRTRFATAMAFDNAGGDFDLHQQLDQRGIRTADAIVGYLFNLLLNHSGELEREQALAILNEGGDFAMGAEDAPLKLQRLLALLISYPGFQYQ